jgi:hypothetical protein
MIGSTLVLFWTSVVPVSSLGLLLGRDFMDAVASWALHAAAAA